MNLVTSAASDARHTPGADMRRYPLPQHVSNPSTRDQDQDQLARLGSGLQPYDLVYGVEGVRKLIVAEPFSYDRHVEKLQIFDKDGRDVTLVALARHQGEHYPEDFKNFEQQVGEYLADLVGVLAKKPKGPLNSSAFLGDLGKCVRIGASESEENKHILNIVQELQSRAICELSRDEGLDLLNKLFALPKIELQNGATSFGTTARECLRLIGNAVYGKELLNLTPEQINLSPNVISGKIYGDAFQNFLAEARKPVEQRDMLELKTLKQTLLDGAKNINDAVHYGFIRFSYDRLQKEAREHEEMIERENAAMVDRRPIDDLVRSIDGEPASAEPVTKSHLDKSPDELQTRIERFMKWAGNLEEHGMGTPEDPYVRWFFKKTAHDLKNTDDPAEFDKAEDAFGTFLTKCSHEVTQQYHLAKTLRQTFNDAWCLEKTRMQKIKAEAPQSDTPATAKDTDYKKIAKKVHKQLMHRHASILAEKQNDIDLQARQITEASLSLLDDYDLNRDMLIADPLVITKISHPLNAPDISFTTQRSKSEEYSAGLNDLLWPDPVLRDFRLTFGTKKWLDKKYTTQGPKVNYQAVTPARNLLQLLKLLADEPDRHGNRLKAIAVAHDTALLAATTLEPINNSMDSLLKTVNLDIRMRRERTAANA